MLFKKSQSTRKNSSNHSSTKEKQFFIFLFRRRQQKKFFDNFSRWRGSTLALEVILQPLKMQLVCLRWGSWGLSTPAWSSSKNRALLASSMTSSQAGLGLERAQIKKVLAAKLTTWSGFQDFLKTRWNRYLNTLAEIWERKFLPALAFAPGSMMKFQICFSMNKPNISFQIMDVFQKMYLHENITIVLNLTKN